MAFVLTPTRFRDDIINDNIFKDDNSFSSLRLGNSHHDFYVAEDIDFQNVKENIIVFYLDDKICLGNPLDCKLKISGELNFELNLHTNSFIFYNRELSTGYYFRYNDYYFWENQLYKINSFFIKEKYVFEKNRTSLYKFNANKNSFVYDKDVNLKTHIVFPRWEQEGGNKSCLFTGVDGKSGKRCFGLQTWELSNNINDIKLKVVGYISKTTGRIFFHIFDENNVIRHNIISLIVVNGKTLPILSRIVLEEMETDVIFFNNEYIGDAMISMNNTVCFKRKKQQDEEDENNDIDKLDENNDIDKLEVYMKYTGLTNLFFRKRFTELGIREEAFVGNLFSWNQILNKY